MKIFNDVYQNVDAREFTVIVALDISAAFDTICHAKLLDRLCIDLGLCGVALEWIASYLADHQQYMKIGEHSSTTRKLESDVPQGSVLGPMLFTAYVSPFGDVITSMGLKHHQYADNTQLYFAVRASHNKDDLNIIEKCTSSVQDWFLVNDRLLNPTKLEVGTATQHHTTISAGMVAVAGAPLSFVDKILFYLKFSRHI